MIEAKIVADSINPQGDRITTYLLTFPRFILAELNTHRVFSKNSASSRAIPFKKMVEMVETDPFIPIAWQKDHKGMQGIEYWGKEDWVVDQPNVSQINVHNCAIDNWLQARDNAVSLAKQLNSKNVTKQLCNRLLEPFMWHTVLLTGTEFENFFELRCPQYCYLSDDGITPIWFKSKKDFMEYDKKQPEENKVCLEFDEIGWRTINKSQAEIHMQALAEAMWDAYNENTPKKLQAGEWHIPFRDKMQDKDIMQYIKGKFNSRTKVEEAVQKFKLKVSTARCARLSYMTFDGEIDYGKDIALHDKLLESHHMSPFEHCARAMSNEEYQFFIKGKGIPDYNLGISSSNPVLTFRKNEEGWCNNYKGFIPYRYIIENKK